MSDRLDPIRPSARPLGFGHSTGAEERAERFRASLDLRDGAGQSTNDASGRESAGPRDHGERSTDAVAWTAPRRALLLLLRDSVLAATARVLRLPDGGGVAAAPTQAYAHSSLLRLEAEPLPTVDEWLGLVRTEQHGMAGPRRVGHDAIGPWSNDRIERALGVAMRRGVEAAVRTFGEGLGVEEDGPVGLFDVLSARLPADRR